MLAEFIDAPCIPPAFGLERVFRKYALAYVSFLSFLQCRLPDETSAGS